MVDFVTVKWGGRPERLIAARIVARYSHCCICGEVVEKWRKKPDPLSPSVEHLRSRSNGGTNDEANLRLAHLGCNSAKGNRDVELKPERIQTREW